MGGARKRLFEECEDKSLQQQTQQTLLAPSDAAGPCVRLPELGRAHMAQAMRDACDHLEQEEVRSRQRMNQVATKYNDLLCQDKGMPSTSTITFYARFQPDLPVTLAHRDAWAKLLTMNDVRQFHASIYVAGPPLVLGKSMGNEPCLMLDGGVGGVNRISIKLYYNTVHVTGAPCIADLRRALEYCRQLLELVRPLVPPPSVDDLANMTRKRRPQGIRPSRIPVADVRAMPAIDVTEQEDEDDELLRLFNTEDDDLTAYLLGDLDEFPALSLPAAAASLNASAMTEEAPVPLPDDSSGLRFTGLSVAMINSDFRLSRRLDLVAVKDRDRFTEEPFLSCVKVAKHPGLKIQFSGAHARVGAGQYDTIADHALRAERCTVLLFSKRRPDADGKLSTSTVGITGCRSMRVLVDAYDHVLREIRAHPDVWQDAAAAGMGLDYSRHADLLDFDNVDE